MTTAMVMAKISWLFLTLAAAERSQAPGFYPHFSGRRDVTLLDGQWMYGLHTDESMDSLGEIDTANVALTPSSVQVPHTMDTALPGLLGPRGVAFYRTKFTQRGLARLQFMGCSFYCRVFVDGQDVGEHRAGGYVPFWLDLAPQSQQEVERELLVLADNRFNATTAPTHTGGDFWMYGGLVRSVLLHDMPDDDEVWVWRAHMFPKEEFGLVDINLILTNSSFSGRLPYRITFDQDEQVITGSADAQDGKIKLEGVHVPNPRQWSLTDPQLHTVTVTTYGASITERFGLRTWGVDKASGRLTLNGEIVKLYGWNHHTQWIDTGISPSDDQLDQDLALLIKGNANYVRGAHYPQDQRWLDRMDENGFAMWEETLGPNTTVENLNDWDHFMKYQLRQIDQMLEASMNHPSIMTWGWFNEGPSNDQAACAGYAACSQRVAEQDPTRFRTWASNKQSKDVCLEHATAVSFNHYPAWYQHLYDLEDPARTWNHNAAWSLKHFPGKPFFISETGAGGLFEWDNETAVQWSLKYQTEVVARDVDVGLANENISGMTIWHFFDFKGNDAGQICGPCVYEPKVWPPTCSYYNMSDLCIKRPGGVNHKGSLDPWRREKPVFAVVAEKFGHAREAIMRATKDDAAIVI